MTQKKLYKRLCNNLDELWRIAIKLRDKGKCVLCSKTDRVNAHHCIVPERRSLAIRWHMQNGITLCQGCHMGVHSCQKSILDEYMDLLNKRISRDDQETLEATARAGGKFHVSELEEMKHELQRLINDMREV